MTDKDIQDLFWDWFQTSYDIEVMLLLFHPNIYMRNFRMNGWLLEYIDNGDAKSSHDVREIEMWGMFEPILRQKEREQKLKSLGL